MQGILELMIKSYNEVRMEGSYLILLLASLYVLYRLNAKRNQWAIYYALLGLVLVCANPVLVQILSQAFPVLRSFQPFLLFVPLLFYIPLAAAELYERKYDNKHGAAFLIVLTLLIGISGNLYGLYRDENAKMNRCGKAQQEVIEWIREEQPMLVAADESLLPFLRMKAPEIELLYGRDLYQPGMDLGIIDVYGEELLHFYEAMKEPENTLDDILETADMYGCDMVVLRSFEDAPKKQGHFVKTEETDHYIVYCIQ